MHKKLLCEISRKAQKVRIIFSSRFLQKSGARSPQREVRGEESSVRRGSRAQAGAGLRRVGGRGRVNNRLGRNAFFLPGSRSRPATQCN